MRLRRIQSKGFLADQKKFGLSPKLLSLYVATSPELDGVSGEYFDKSARAPSSSESQNAEIARRLWDLSAELTGCG